jgi:riboflavin kinase/FMN adenylyltransferase
MQVVFGIKKYYNQERPLYLALGNFDGVHRGHQQLIKNLVSRLRKIKAWEELYF